MDHYKIIETFQSKRNQVFLATNKNNNCFVVKQFSSIDNFTKELEIAQLLLNNHVSIPKIIDYYNKDFIYEYVPSTNLIDLISIDNKEIFHKLLLWLKDVYIILENEYKTPTILGDIHLRNFLWTDKIYGVDFESVQQGIIESDIASLLVYLSTYHPMYTETKLELTNYLYEQSIKILNCNRTRLNREINKFILLLEKRRNCLLTNTNYWNKILKK